MIQLHSQTIDSSGQSTVFIDRPLTTAVPGGEWNYEIVDEREVKFYADGDSSCEYFWDFGDGESSNIKNPVHFYEEPFYYDVSLITKNKHGSKELILELDLISINSFAQKAPDIQLYPNPNKGKFDLKISYDDKVFLEVMDHCGLLFWSSPWSFAEENEVDLSHLPDGTYNLNVVSNNEIFKHRFEIIR